jgi:hypothetical protein
MKITFEQWNLKVGNTVTMKNGKRLSVNEVDCGLEFWGTTQDGKQGMFRLEDVASIENSSNSNLNAQDETDRLAHIAPEEIYCEEGYGEADSDHVNGYCE